MLLTLASCQQDEPLAVEPTTSGGRTYQPTNVASTTLSSRGSSDGYRTTDAELAAYAAQVEAWENGEYGSATYSVEQFIGDAANHLNYTQDALAHVTSDSKVKLAAFPLSGESIDEETASTYIADFEATIATWLSELSGDEPGVRFAYVGLNLTNPEEPSLTLLAEVGSDPDENPELANQVLSCYSPRDCHPEDVNSTTTLWGSAGTSNVCTGSANAQIEARLNRNLPGIDFGRDLVFATVNPTGGLTTGVGQATIGYANLNLDQRLGPGTPGCEGEKIVHRDPEQDEICFQDSQIKDYVCEQADFANNDAEDAINNSAQGIGFEFVGASVGSSVVDILGDGGINYHVAAYFYSL